MAGVQVQQASGIKKSRIKQCMRIVTVAIMIAVVCGEIALYVQIRLPKSIGSEVINQEDNQESCRSETYTGDVCKNSIQMYQQCFGEGCNSSEIRVALTKDQLKIAEEKVLSALNRAEMMNLSQTYMEDFSSFICLYYFGQCDGNGQLNFSSSEECEIIRNETCTGKWLLPNTTGSSGNMTEIQIEIWNNISKDQLLCNKGFYLNESIGICLPECGKWNLYSDSVETVLHTAMIISGSIGLIAGILGLVYSCIYYKQIFRLPTALVVYQTISMSLYVVVVLIGRIDPTALFCSSKDMGESFSNPTIYCMVSGATDVYVSSQIVIWWFTYVAITFWAVVFPFHYRSFQAAGKTKYIHMLAVLVGVLLPLVPLVTIICTGKFITVLTIPTIQCSSSNTDVRFYVHFLPLILLYTTGTPLFIYIFLQVCRKYLLKESKQIRVAASAKIILYISYYAGIVTYVLLILAIRKHHFPEDSYTQALREYFLCENAGISPGKTCDRSEFNQSLPYLLPFEIIPILSALLPVVTLIYVVNIHEVKQSCRNNRRIKQES